MAANDAKTEVPSKVTSPNDASEAARIKQQSDAAHAKLLLDSQSKPPTAKEKEALSDTGKLVHDFVKSFTDVGATDAQAKQAFQEFASATKDSDRAKVFTDANVTPPPYVATYEAKYGAGTHDAISGSIALAKRLEKEQGAPVEAPKPTDARILAPAPAATSAEPAVVLNKANDAINKSLTSLATVQTDGKPLPDSLKQVFQAAVDASSKITPDMITKQRSLLYGSVPDWNQAKEDKYLSVNKAFNDATKNLSPAVQATLEKLPQTASPADQLAAVEKMTTDPSAVALKKADDALKAFHQVTPGADQRDGIDGKLHLLFNLSHAQGASAAIYAEALAKTGNAGDIPQAQAMMTEAAKDKNLTAVIPTIQQIYDKVMGPGAPTAPEADPLDKTIPGWTQTKAAMAAMSDQSLSPEQRIKKAAPLYEAALNAAKSINPDDIDAAQAKIGAAVSDMTGGRAKSLSDLDKPENADLVKTITDSPEKRAQATELVNQSAILDRARQQNLLVSESYAQALSKTASELQAQANQDKPNAAKFNTEANALTDRAATVLKTLGQTDPNFGVAVDSAADPETAKHMATLNQNRIAEEIAQVNRGEAIDPKKAAAVSGSQMAVDAINDSIMGHKYKFETALFGNQIDGSINVLKTVRPLEVGVNATIEGLDYVHGHVPVVGAVTGFASDMMKGYLPSPDTAMPNAVEDLANAKLAHPQTAKEVIEAKKESVLGNAVSLSSDLASGQIGMLTAKATPGLIAKALPEIEETALKTAIESGNWKIKLGAAATVGVAAAFGSRWAADELSHDILGTKRMSVGELASHSTAALAAAYTARGLTSAMPATEGALVKKLGQTALTSAATSTVFGLGEVNPFVTNKATGQHYTAADTLMNAGENLAFGATTGMAARAVTPFVHFSTVGVAQGIGSVAKGVGKFVFNSEAGREVAESTVSAATKEIKPVFTGLTSGFMGTSIRSALARDAVGTAIGATGSFVAVNPWETNATTGKNYTVGETLQSAAEFGLGTGAAFAAARYPFAGLGMGYRAAVNALPGEGSTVARFMGNNLIAGTERFAVGGTVGTAGSLIFGDKVDANGRAYTTGEIVTNSLTSGLEFGSGLAAAPFAYSALKSAGKFIPEPVKALSPIDAANAVRRGLGTAAEKTGSVIANGANTIAGEGTILGNKVVSPVSKFSAKVSTKAGDAATQYGPGVRNFLLPHANQVSTSLSEFYEHEKLEKLDELSDERAKAIKAEQDAEKNK
ncbi:MAG: hypothetical protein P4L53_02135 [Candidatus Obscuribacterales bacterium]|nr:hypothetical protein [Candidatus Obscuribacterales bacterium]